MKTFETSCPVRFADCDPAGIVFFPQYLVMHNTLVEKWFDEALGISYAGLIGQRRVGLPTARLEVDFTAVSRHGEHLQQRLWVDRLGHSSLVLRSEYRGDGELRLRLRQVLVCVSLATLRPQTWPDDVRAAIEPYLVTEGGA